MLVALLWRGFDAVLVPLHPISASNLLTVEFAFEARSDPHLRTIPEAVHLAGQVFCELGCLDH